MLKSAAIISAILLGAVASISSTPLPIPAAAEQVKLTSPETDAIIAQFAYLEISHDGEEFALSITDETAIFMDVTLPGKLHVRVGF